MEGAEEIKKSLEEPNFHKNNRTLCMKIFPQLAKKTNLSLKEIEYYYYLKSTEIMSYDNTNPDHEVLSFSNI